MSLDVMFCHDPHARGAYALPVSGMSPGYARSGIEKAAPEDAALALSPAYHNFPHVKRPGAGGT